MDVGGYIRVSSVGLRDRDKFLSPTLQRERIQGWCDTHGHNLVLVHTDLDVSGGSADRPNLLDLVQRVERGALQVVVVAKLDRFGRNLIHGIALIDRIDKAGGQFVSVADGFDTSSPYGRLALNIMLSIAQFELERYREQSREARAKMIQQGRHPGPVALGYIRGEDGVFVLHPTLAPIVKQLFERKAGGESPSDLARWLRDLGIRTGRGGEPGGRFVRELIARPVYRGQARSAEFENDVAHPAIVSDETWARANNAPGVRPPRSSEARPLSGLVRCAGCRYVMSAATTPYADGPRKAYRCRGRHAAGRCPAPAFAMEDQLMSLVEEQFLRRVGDMKASAAGDLDRLEELRADLDRARALLVAFRDDPEVQGSLRPGDFAEGLRVRAAAVDALEREIRSELAARPDDLPDATVLRLAWPEIDVDTRRRMLRAVFDAVVVRKPSVHRSHREPLVGRVWFVERGDMAEDVPRPGRKPVAIRGFDVGDPSGTGPAGS